MKNLWAAIAILAVLVITLGMAGWAYAQSNSEIPYPGNMMGAGWSGHNGRGMYGQGMMGTGHMGEGWEGMMGPHQGMEALHEYMFPAMASALGLTPDEFVEKHAAGESFWDLAAAQGMTQDEASALMLAARAEALQQAVEAGAIDQATAEWMLEHADQMHAGGAWTSGGHCDEAGARAPNGMDY